MSAQAEKKTGRPSKLPTIDLNRVEALGQYGATNEQIASILKIAPSTLYEYQNKFPEFSEALKRGKAGADIKVVQALYNRAVGRRVVVRQTKNGPVEEIQQIDPDVIACIFWTKNRMSELWKDKHDFEHSGEIDSVLTFEFGEAIPESRTRTAEKPGEDEE